MYHAQKIHQVTTSTGAVIDFTVHSLTGTLEDKHAQIERTCNGALVESIVGIYWNDENELTDYDGALFLSKGLIATIEKMGLTINDDDR